MKIREKQSKKTQRERKDSYEKYSGSKELLKQTALYI